MAEEQRKWSTVFMGEREATAQELEAMQEPLLRERMRHRQQEDYLARVRAKAEERAREILGAAYAERQRVLDEAAKEARVLCRNMTVESEAMKARSQDALESAQAELARAEALREEACSVRNAAHDEGFAVGREKAAVELKALRTEMGISLGEVLRGLEAQRESLAATWREELADLTRAAVEAGTGWTLEAEHERILRHLVLDSLKRLEDRAVVTVRVHPEDEAFVGELFLIARESAPDLRQWVVTGDASLERGSILAESGSGSVDCRRKNYREMVDNILNFLTLPPRDEDGRRAEEVSVIVEREARRMAEMLPPLSVPEQEAEKKEVLEAELDALPEEKSHEDAALPATNAGEEQAGPLDEAFLSPEDGPGTEDAEPELAEAEHEMPEAACPEDATPELRLPREERSADAPDNANPSLAELEEELFPVTGNDVHTSEEKAKQVFSRGGFLDDADEKNRN